ncbi:MAG: trypsin-like serine protease [Hyphomonadaceae bacterium]|nr:trypsin-like serine protease [Hyphomonadaceae bacterium]
MKAQAHLGRLLVGAAAFALFTAAPAGAQDVGVSQAPLLTGTLTRARPEVGTLDNGSCTATLIAPQWVVTAAHCTGHISMFYPSGVTRDRTFSIDPADGSARQDFPIERVYSLGFPIGSRDIMVMRLATPVPNTLATPALLASRAPANGAAITVFGYGCNSVDPTRAGRKQVTPGVLTIDGRGTFTSQNTICPGDSGGPVFAGSGDRGRLFAVNSQLVGTPPAQTDVYADVVNRRTEIFATMLSGEIRPNEDITMSRWCSAANEQLFYGDVNGDNLVDGICHNASTGAVGYARGMAGAIRPEGAFAGPFCSHAGAQFHVGDFNGDDRTDIFCNDTRTGHKWVHFSQGGWRAPYIALPDYESTSVWCSHATAQLFIGDFNGDGQSDMLCRDSGNGQLWIDYSARPGSGEGLFNSNNYENPGPWCSHATTSLLVADFNGDGRSDLLCHTRSNGGIDVKLARDGDVFGGRQWQDTRANFCRTGRLAAFDMTGDNRAELFCFDADGSGGELIIAIGDGVPFQTEISWTRGSWAHGVTRPLLVGNVAATPWGRVR